MIVIREYDPEWPTNYERERDIVLNAIGNYLVALEHIGSTAVPGLAAKPIIDLVGGLAKIESAAACVDPLRQSGYEFIPGVTKALTEDRYFERWSDALEVGTELAHLHLTEYGSRFWNRLIAFRDLLRRDPIIARQYEALKYTLAPQYTSGFAYSVAKEEFIKEALNPRTRLE